MAKPTHYLWAKRKTGKTPHRRIGVGWINDLGWVSIQLDPCVFLTDRDDIYINLYPIESNPNEAK